jgi:hypothetical protein
MTTVLESSPRRLSLLTSPGLSEPLFLQTDLGIRSVITPGEFECSTTVAPRIEVRNYGTATITSAKIQISVNNVIIETVSASLNLPNLEITTIDFSPVLVGTGNNEIDFLVIEVNGTTDQNSNNNNATVTFNVPNKEATPYSENFNSFPTKWSIRNPDGKKTWELVTAPRESPTNKAMRLNLFDYDESYGEVDMLVSPILDLSSAPVAAVIFDVAFARHASQNDRLKVVVLSDCEDVEDGTVIYDKFALALKTVTTATGPFVPSGTVDWRREFINISQFIGQPNIQLAFVAISDWGNNLYLDNISVLTTELEDVELQAMETPGFITCESNPSPVVVVQNIGTKVINSLTVQYSVNGIASEITVNDLNASLGDEFKITLPALDLSAPSNTIAISLVNPNGKVDQSPANNSKTFPLLFDQTTERIPTRQNFDGGFGAWKTFNPDGGKTWQLTNTNFNGTVYFNAHNNLATNEISWLISPVLDFSATTEASLVFDYSYRQRLGRLESLKVYGSKDCGGTFEEITTVDLSSQEFSSAWAPTSEEEWVRDFIVNLNEYVGESSVRIAFAVINDNGNNLFLDNLEFFVTDDPVLITLTDSYNVYGYNATDLTQSDLKITFNLAERSEVEYLIVDVMGKTLGSARLQDVLNQTYSLNESKQLASGTYILKMRIGTQSFTDRFLIVR